MTAWKERDAQLMKNRRTILVCPKCETQLSIYDDRENKQLLYCDKCEKIYQYYGPKEVEVQRGTNKEAVAGYYSRFMRELT